MRMAGTSRQFAPARRVRGGVVEAPPRGGLGGGRRRALIYAALTAGAFAWLWPQGA